MGAWNDVMYRHSQGDDDYIIFMDGDIIFLQENNLENLVYALEFNPEAWISTDRPVKDIAVNKSSSVLQKMSLAFSKFTSNAPGQLCAQLYCSRSTFLRRMSIPEGIVAEDTYLKYMAVTDGLTKKQNLDRLIVVDNASHLFEAYVGFGDYFKNQVRQTISFTIWRVFKRHIAHQIASQNALEYSKERYLEDPQWFNKLLRREFGRKKFWFIYSGAFSVRFKRLKFLSLIGKVKMFIPVIFAWLIDVIVFVSSNRKIKSGSLKNIWPDTESKRLANVYSLPDSQSGS